MDRLTNTMKKKLRKIVYPILLLFTLYIIAGLILARRQDMIIFKPVPLDTNYVFKTKWSHRAFNIPVSEASTLNILYLYTDSAKGQVLYFPENSSNISTHLSRLSFFLERGYNVFIPDYPGFGKSTGKPTEQSLNKTAEIVYQLAAKYMSADSTILYGKGLGGAVAAYLASRHSGKALVLASPFYSLYTMASHYFPIYPVKKYLHYDFPVYRYVQRTFIPVILFHGKEDGVISFSQARKLSERLADKDRFVPLPDASHEDVMQQPLYYKVMDSLLEHSE